MQRLSYLILVCKVFTHIISHSSPQARPSRCEGLPISTQIYASLPKVSEIVMSQGVWSTTSNGIFFADLGTLCSH